MRQRRGGPRSAGHALGDGSGAGRMRVVHGRSTRSADSDIAPAKNSSISSGRPSANAADRAASAFCTCASRRSHASTAGAGARTRSRCSHSGQRRDTIASAPRVDLAVEWIRSLEHRGQRVSGFALGCRCRWFTGFWDIPRSSICRAQLPGARLRTGTRGGSCGESSAGLAEIAYGNGLVCSQLADLPRFVARTRLLRSGAAEPTRWSARSPGGRAGGRRVSCSPDAPRRIRA
jgi:hypothetical protein